MKYAFSVAFLVSAQASFAGATLPDGCETKIVGHAQRNQISELPLWFDLNGVEEAGNELRAVVEGRYVDMESDFIYVETHHVRLDNTNQLTPCGVVSSNLVGVSLY